MSCPRSSECQGKAEGHGRATGLLYIAGEKTGTAALWVLYDELAPIGRGLFFLYPAFTDHCLNLRIHTIYDTIFVSGHPADSTDLK